MTLLSRLRSFLKELRELVRISEAQEIARRMFVTNTIDGLISSMGIILGTYLLGGRDPLIYLGAVVGGNSAMGLFSAFLGTYFSERAERLRELKELEKAMAADLRGSIYWRSSKIVPLYVAAWSSLGMLTLPVLCSSPLLLAHEGLISLRYAILASLVLLETAMFLLGSYLGRISGEKWYMVGLRMLLVGLATITLYLLIELA